MCCLRYEHDFYVQQRRRFPKEGKIVETGAGSEKVVSNDIFRERVTLRNSEGELRIVALADLRLDEKKAPAGRLGEPLVDEETPALPFEALSDEVLRLQDTSELPAWMPRSDLGDAVPRPPRALPVREEPAKPAAESRAPQQPQGRSAEKARVSPPDRGRRDAGRPDRVDREGSQGQREDEPAQTSESSATPPGSPAPEETRRGRRRRGRRGGRRSRGQGGGPGGTASDSPPGGDGE